MPKPFLNQILVYLEAKMSFFFSVVVPAPNQHGKWSLHIVSAVSLSFFNLSMGLFSKWIPRTLELTASLHLKIDGWKMNFLLGGPIFSGYVSFREGTFMLFSDVPRTWPFNYTHKTTINHGPTKTPWVSQTTWAWRREKTPFKGFKTLDFGET